MPRSWKLGVTRSAGRSKNDRRPRRSADCGSGLAASAAADDPARLTAGAKIAPGVTPSKFVLVKVLGGRQESPISDQTTVAFQLWGDNGISDDHARTSAGRIVTAHAQRGLNARRTSGVVPLPDPTDPARQISQVTITATLRGEDQ